MDLMHAVMTGDLENVNKWVNQSNVNLSDNSDRTPLMAAVFKNLTQIAETLLTAGANMYEKDKEGYSVLYYAAVHGNFESVMVLYENGFQYKQDLQTWEETIQETNNNGHAHIVELLEAIAKQQG